MFTIGLPKWAMESTDPYVMRLVEESYLEGVGHVREFFDELIAGGACQDAHPQTETAPAVQVALDNQARFLNWVAKGAQPTAEDIATDGTASSVPVGKPSAKPWLGRPTYITVLSYAMQNGARTPKEAHNRAYAADTLRLADRIVDYDAAQGFLVMLNKEKQQRGLVPLADARVVYPHLPAPAKARMKQLSAGQAH